MSSEAARDGPSVVTVGVDGSRTSLRALAYAGGLTRRQGARLVAVHVSFPAGSGWAALSGALSGEVSGLLAATCSELRDALQHEIASASTAAGFDVELLTAVGDPFVELTRLCDELRTDLVVVGASESAGHRLMGSLAARLVRAGRWPVTVVP